MCFLYETSMLYNSAVISNELIYMILNTNLHVRTYYQRDDYPAS
jgi:hypothetical protein